MHAMPKISVLIPAYNVERYVARCLDSVISQTFDNLEIIVVDDASTDNTPEILYDYAKRDERIRIVRHAENSGILWVRKTGVEASTGDYIMFVDSDDALKNNACERLYSAAIETRSDLVIAGYEFCSYGGGRTQHINVSDNISSSYDLFKAMLNNHITKYVWGRIFKRGLLVECPPEYQKNINLGEDLIISFHVARFVEKATCIPDILYEYYENKASVSHVYSPDLIRDNIKALLKTVELSAAVGEDLRGLAETQAIKRIHALIKKREGEDRRLVMSILEDEGASRLFSFKSLLSHLGIRKGITYYLVTRFNYFSKIA